MSFKDRSPNPGAIPIGVEGDNNSQQVRFSFDRVLSGRLYLKLEGEDFIDKIPLSHDGSAAVWQVGGEVAPRMGRMLGQLQLEDDGGVVWQTYKFSLNISSGIAADEHVEEHYPSVLRDLEQRVVQMEEYVVLNCEKGDTGEQGLTGPQGENGEQGEKGDQGEQGRQGPTGEQGPQGEKGEQGEKGDSGDKGDKGEDGTSVRILGRLEDMSELPEDAQSGDGYMVGSDFWSYNGAEWSNIGSIQGPRGEQGGDGEQGPQGEKGDKGDTGAQGIQGEKGDKGDTGAQGIQGAKGDKGDTGAQGIQGVKGEKGDKGDKGDTGTQGIKGEKGDKGDTGVQGIKGEKGDKGDSGDVNCYTRTESDARYSKIADGAAAAFAIPSSAWKQSSVYAGFAFEADVAASGISGSELVRADFDMRSWILACAAEVASAGDTSAGKFKLYAKYMPEGALSGRYTVSRAVS